MSCPCARRQLAPTVAEFELLSPHALQTLHTPISTAHTAPQTKTGCSTVPIMNYSLLTDSPFNTALLSPEGRAVYRIDTYLSSFTTTVKKVGGGQSEVEIGRVVWQSGRPGTAVVHGHEIYVNKSSFFSSSRTFTALNGQSYKWTFNEGSALMASNDSRQAPVATYTPATRTNPGLLHITPHGLTITGDVILSFVCVEGERRHTMRKSLR